MDSRKEDIIVSGAYSPSNNKYSSIYSIPRLFSSVGTNNLSSSKYHVSHETPKSNSEFYHNNIGTYQSDPAYHRNCKSYHPTPNVHPSTLYQPYTRGDQPKTRIDKVYKLNHSSRKPNKLNSKINQGLMKESYSGANYPTVPKSAQHGNTGFSRSPNSVEPGSDRSSLQVSQVRINLLAGVAKRNAAQGKVNYREVEKRILDGILGPKVYDNRMRPHVSLNYIQRNNNNKANNILNTVF